MVNTAKNRNSHKLEAITLALLGLVFLFQASCSGALTTTGVILGEKATNHSIFRSNDYAVCLLKCKETPSNLADRLLGDARKSWLIEDANEGVSFEKGQRIIIPLKDENKGGLTADGYQVVPILVYHRFAEKCESPLCMPVDIFDQQMRYLKDNGYRVITMDRLLGFLQYRHAIPRKSVVINIDDGYRSIYNTAYPILKKYGFRATLFIYTDFVGASKSAITWDQLREMKSDGFEVASHTLSHCDLTKRREGEDAKAHAARIKKELFVSKEIIDEELEQDTISIAFPYGYYDERILNICDKVGYKIGVTVRGGGNPFFSDPLVLRRDQILQKDIETFIAKLKINHRFFFK